MRISDWSSDVCSSDLTDRSAAAHRRQWLRGARRRGGLLVDIGLRRRIRQCDGGRRRVAPGQRGRSGRGRHFVADPHRSEEHTSELQSLMRISYAVFCLKKKKTTKIKVTTHNYNRN